MTNMEFVKTLDAQRKRLDDVLYSLRECYRDAKTSYPGASDVYLYAARDVEQARNSAI